MHFLNRSFIRFAGPAVFSCVAIAFVAMPMKIAGAAQQSDALWLTNYQQALAQAAKEKKNVLIDFTGSDWCPPCIQMEKEVLSQREFIAFAKNNLVLLKLDFPRRKKLSPEEKEQNHKLGQQFRIRGCWRRSDEEAYFRWHSQSQPRDNALQPFQALRRQSVNDRIGRLRVPGRYSRVRDVSQSIGPKKRQRSQQLVEFLRKLVFEYLRRPS